MTTTVERPAPAYREPRMAPDTRRRLSIVIVGVAAWIIGLIFVAPVLWMVLTSLHSEPDAATNPPSFFAPLTVEGYANFFGAGTGTSPWPSLINSATASILSTILVLVLSIPAAYALSIRPVRKWTDVMFFFLSTKMLPVVAGLLPVYRARHGGKEFYFYSQVIIYTSMNLPIAVWMMRSFLAEVPVEMLEAASLDGAGLIRRCARSSSWSCCPASRPRR
jgi:sorbitol/mannitol transport system permease protein